MRPLEVEHEMNRVANLLPNGLIWQVDPTLHHAGREARKGLRRRVGVNRGQRTAVAGIESLHEVEGFPTPYLP